MCVDQIKQIECNQLYIKLIEKYGINAQLIKTAEEAVELSKEEPPTSDNKATNGGQQ